LPEKFRLFCFKHAPEGEKNSACEAAQLLIAEVLQRAISHGTPEEMPGKSGLVAAMHLTAPIKCVPTRQHKHTDTFTHFYRFWYLNEKSPKKAELKCRDISISKG